jgi:hypothetical protein
MRHAMRPPPIPPPLAPAAATARLLSPPAPAALTAAPPTPSKREAKRQRRETAAMAAAALAPTPNPRIPNPLSPIPRPNPRNPNPTPSPSPPTRREPLAPGQLADQGTVADGICTLTFAPANGAGARTSSWRVNECAVSLGIDPSAVCWPKVIISAQARVPGSQADHAMARCKHIGQPGHEHDNSAAHVVPVGLTSSVLASFRNP